MGLVEAIHPALGTIDYRQPMSKLVFIGGSLLLFTTVFTVSALVSYGLKHYRNLRSREKVLWNLTVVRGLSGIFATAMGIWAIWWDEVMIQDVVHATTATSFVTIYVMTGFFLLDILAYTTSDLVFGTFNPMMLAHHFISLLGLSLTVYYECCHSFVLSCLLLEMPSPFSAFCWVLRKCGLADSLAWKVNQMVLVHGLRLSSVLDCYMWLQTCRQWGYLWNETPFPLFSVQLVGLSFSTFALTPYWIYRATSGLFNPIDSNFNDSRKYDQEKRHAPETRDGRSKKRK